MQKLRKVVMVLSVKKLYTKNAKAYMRIPPSKHSNVLNDPCPRKGFTCLQFEAVLMATFSLDFLDFYYRKMPSKHPLPFPAPHSER